MCRTRLRGCLCVQTHAQNTRGFSNRDTTRAAGTGWRMQAQARRRQATDWEAGVSGGCSLPSSERSIPLPRWDKHPLPALNQLQRGWGGGLDRGGEEKKKTSGKKNSFPATEEKDKVWIH